MNSLKQPDLYHSSTPGNREICLVPAGSSLQGNCAGTGQRLICLYWRHSHVLDLRCFGKLLRVDLVISYRRFGTTYRLITLEDGTDRFRNVDNYQCRLRNTPGEQRSYRHRGGSLKSHKAVCVELVSQADFSPL